MLEGDKTNDACNKGTFMANQIFLKFDFLFFFFFLFFVSWLLKTVFQKRK